MKQIVHYWCIMFMLLSLAGCGESNTATVGERTLAIIKPDAVQANKSGNIIDSIEQHDFTIVQLNKRKLKRSEVEQFYNEHRKKPFFGALVDFMTSGPVVLMVLQKDNAVADWRALMGETDPEKAQEKTIRKQFGTTITKNAVHGSESPETAQQEIAFFFPELTTETCDY